MQNDVPLAARPGGLWRPRLARAEALEEALDSMKPERIVGAARFACATRR